MSVTKQLPKYERYCLMDCPICGQENIMVAMGLVSLCPEEIAESPDIGYAFCNCKNIFYTNWRNIDQSTYYDEEYHERHLGDDVKETFKTFFSEYKPLLDKHGNGGKKLLDIGCETDYLLDLAKEDGYETTGMDLLLHGDTAHSMVVGDVDKCGVTGNYDVIFANHLFEHLHYPIRAINHCYEALNDGGLLFISGPDPFQVNWDMPKRFTNWVVRQHYIMWDMDSFCDEMEENGFTTLLKKRNLDVRFLQDYHLLFKK